MIIFKNFSKISELLEKEGPGLLKSVHHWMQENPEFEKTKFSFDFRLGGGGLDSYHPSEVILIGHKTPPNIRFCSKLILVPFYKWQVEVQITNSTKSNLRYLCRPRKMLRYIISFICKISKTKYYGYWDSIDEKGKVKLGTFI